jgi:DNA-binding transcriptional regulator LsrR (DeoR family)
MDKVKRPKLKPPPTIEDLRQVAKWLYHEGRTNQEIADVLEVDVRRVYEMVHLAKAKGVIRFEFPDAVGSPEELALKTWFPHLQELIVVDPRDGCSYDELLKQWGEEAAAYFNRITAKGQHHVGVTGGLPVLQFCEALGPRKRENVDVYTTALIGRGPAADKTVPVDPLLHIDPLVNATILWSKCGSIPGHCHYATVPPFHPPDRSAIASELDALLRRKPVSDAINLMNKITIAIGSIGLTRSPASLTKEHTMIDLVRPIVSPEELADEGAFADFGYCPFDLAGNGDSKWRFFLTAGDNDPDPRRHGIGFYKQMVDDEHIVVVIAGSHKVEALIVALKARIFNVWITDRGAVNAVHAEILRGRAQPRKP